MYSLSLIALLVVTSHSAGSARGTERAVGQMVICAGAQTVVVFFTSDGTPTYATHYCPDCALFGIVVTADRLPTPGTVLGMLPFAGIARREALPVSLPEDALARAPPCLT